MQQDRSVVLRRHLYSLYSLLFIFFLYSSVYAADKTVIPDVHLTSKNNVYKKQDQSISTTHLTREAISKSPVVDLSELFKQEQSVVRLTHNSGDASQTALSLRGFGDNAAANSLILVDGFPLTNPSLLAPYFNSIPLSDIDHIDIFQGSAGTLWGDQAVGGVVNIVTKHPKQFFVNSIVNFGSYNSRYYNILLGDKAANGLFFKTFGIISQTQNYREHNQQNSHNVAAQVGLDYARGTISFNAQSYDNKIYFPGGLSEEQFNNNPRQATDFKNFTYYRTQLFQFLHKHELNNNWLLENRLSYQDTHGNGYIYLNFNRSDTSALFNPQLVGHIAGNKIIVGYNGQISHYQLLNSKVQSKTTAKQNHLYLQTIFPLLNQLDLTLGARSAWQDNQVETVIGQPTYSVNRVFVTEQGLTYRPTQALSFFLRRDGNFSFPKANEETWIPKTIKSLNVQTGTSYEAGSTWHTEKQTAQMSIYRLDLHNEIAFNPAQTINQPFGAFNNLDQTRRYGVTFTELYRLTPQLALKGQFNYVNARFASGAYAGKLIPAVPAINGNMGLNYVWTEHWATQYALLYTGSRYASEDVANVGKKIPAYWLNDIAIQYNLKRAIISFEVENLFNQSYLSYAYYNPHTKANTYYPAAGRYYLFTIKFNID